MQVSTVTQIRLKLLFNTALMIVSTVCDISAAITVIVVVCNNDSSGALEMFK